MALRHDGTPDAEFQGAKMECDLVMKGGVTSGIVYPPAILEVAQKYKFRSIGGTSAGAIAAAMTAAAEYGRDSGGFEKLRDASDELAKKDRLTKLFQPPDPLRSLFEIAMGVLRSQAKDPAPAQPKKSTEGHETARADRRRKIARRTRLTLMFYLARYEPMAFASGALLGFILAYVLAAGLTALFLRFILTPLPNGMLDGPSWVLVTLLAIVLAPIGGTIYALRHLRLLVLKHFAQQGYGICVGMTPPGSSVSALTDWMHEQIQTLANRTVTDPPLTFGDLEGRNDKPIILRIVTSNLSQAQPLILPFEHRDFIFCEEELRTFLPESVVHHLVQHSSTGPLVDVQLQGFDYLPSGPQLPVLLAARMSLSFPLLLSALPLYTVRRSAYEGRPKGQALVVESLSDLQKNWFSDGGISSNFPIHFFDRWLPPLPTFGINLTEMPQEAFDGTSKAQVSGQRISDRFQTANIQDRPKESPADWEECQRGIFDPFTADAVYLPKANAMMFPEWEPIESIGDFLAAIWKTASSFRDSSQTMLPSYRERVVQIRFADNEGGLNLAMKEEAIANIRRKGQWAGEKLRTEFQFDHHRWVRLRVLLGQLEGQMRTTQEKDNSISDYIALLDKQLKAGAEDPNRYPYAQGEDWCTEATRRLKLLDEFTAAWGAMDPGWLETHPEWKEFFPRDSPRPEPVLRITPRL